MHKPPMLIDDDCVALSTSERTLRRRFEETLGKPVRDEIVRHRVEYVKRLAATERDEPYLLYGVACLYSLIGKPALQRERHYRALRGMTKHIGEVGIGALDIALETYEQAEMRDGMRQGTDFIDPVLVAAGHGIQYSLGDFNRLGHLLSPVIVRWRQNGANHRINM